MTAQIVLKYLACVLASKITMENEPLCIPDIQTGILYRLYSQLRRHRRAIGIPDDLAAAQIHHGGQVGPSFFLYMDVSNVRTPFLINGFGFKLTFQNIVFIIRNSSMVGMVVILFATTERRPCSAICLWTRFILQGVPLSLRVRHILTAPYLCFESS